MTWIKLRKKYKINRWRIVKGYENYRVTDDGRLWSCNLQAFVKFHPNKTFYLRVELWKNWKRERPFIHRLVGLHFIKNPNPRVKTEINHIDFDVCNNGYKNLEWVTRRENILHNRNKWKYRKKQKAVSFKKMAAQVEEERKKNPALPPPDRLAYFPVMQSGPIHLGEDPPF